MENSLTDNLEFTVYYFAVVNCMKVRFGKSLQNNNYGEESENVNYESIIGKFVTKKIFNPMEYVRPSLCRRVQYYSMKASVSKIVC